MREGERGEHKNETVLCSKVVLERGHCEFWRKPVYSEAVLWSAFGLDLGIFSSRMELF